MPLFDQDGMENQKSTGSGFGFSATKIGNLGASEYTLVGFALDQSGSVTSFQQEIEACVRSALEGCQKSPRVDNLLARMIRFNDGPDEVHGYRPLADCHLGAYDKFLAPSGNTALYDASIDLIDSMATYGRQLQDQDYAVNGIVIVITDGMDNASKYRTADVKAAIGRVMSQEALESVVTILVGVNVQNPTASAYLKTFKDEAGFREYIETTDASPKTLARLAGFISKSVSSQSQSVGTKGASAPINF